MKKHEHNTIKEDRIITDFCFYVALGLTMISVVFFRLRFLEHGLVFLAISLLFWVLSIIGKIKIESRYTRKLIADINNRSEFDWCPICNPKGVNEASGNS